MFRKFIQFIFACLIIAVLCAAIGYGYLQHYIEKPSSHDRAITLVVPKGMGFSQITSLLNKSGVIDNKLAFKAYVFLKDKQSEFKAGEYLFDPHLPPARVIDILIKGKSIRHSITISEGLIAQDILKIIAAEDKLVGDVPKDIKEGEILPETYHFLRGDSRASVINRMRSAMQRNLAAMWEKRQEGLPLKSKEEALILASIVEKETGLRSERRKVAGVFINRLRKGMKIQSDPTVIYGMYKKTGVFRRGITRKDLRDANEYNTYHIKALPIAPIANPGACVNRSRTAPRRNRRAIFRCKRRQRRRT